MCGIVGFVTAVDQTTPETPFNHHLHLNNRPNDSEVTGDRLFSGKQFLFSGLKKLTYRGYDSCGLALMADENTKLATDEEQLAPNYKIALQKSSGKVSKLEPLLDYLPNHAVLGIAHTRWATHGPPTSINAHPHRQRGLALVHNGIIENAEELKNNLKQKNYLKPVFLSDTDSEVALSKLYELTQLYSTFEEAVVTLSELLEGSFTMAIISEKDYDKIFVIKQGSPLVLGFSDVGAFLASDAFAIQSYAKKLLFLEDGDVGILSHNFYQALTGVSGSLKTQPGQTYHDLNLTSFSSSEDDDDLGDAPHYMYKEIYEQPRVLSQLVSRFLAPNSHSLNHTELGLTKLNLNMITHIHIVGCGSAFYAGLLGALALEGEAGIPCGVSQGSEYRYRSPIITPHTLVIAVSQSGETADTLASVNHALDAGAQVLAICNVEYSSLSRTATSSLLTRVGSEIGVASSKAFTAQVLSLYLLALEFGTIKGIPVPFPSQQLSQLRTALEQTLDLEQNIKIIASKIAGEKSCLFIGRHTGVAVACEGALKLKEVSYIHAEAYPAGELKHGPLALVDSQMYLIAIVPKDNHYTKMLSNIEEVCARGGKVIAVCTEEKDTRLTGLCQHIISVPTLASPLLQSLCCTIALQLLAYHVAVHLGHNVDQPRNLAKSVTVE
ncbi:MAG: glutamine--fructose-6-phosphate transaminase (isomerizing) [Proteobacteria bacterium]|nr:glutamine--fructose-6-phosphate transaminase (isomerizing) [Pseudomonadota bacterium]